MIGFNFEGNLKGARQPQLDFISKILAKNGFEGSKVTIESVGKAGDNYMASIKRIVAEESGKTFKMIAKLAPENPLIREMVNVDIIYRNEHIMYTEVFPKFDQKQKAAGIPENERFRFAICYGSYNEAPNEVILLEDLKEHNFDILNRFEPMTNENVKLVLKSLAIYNALSFATRYQEPETYANFQKLLAPNLDVNGFKESNMQFFYQLEAQLLDIIDDRCKKVVEGSVGKAPKVDAKIRNLTRNSKYTVIQHGDAWTNNMMFRFEKDVPVECVMVDYQIVKENSPVFDLMFMLFNCTTHSQRLQYFYEYIDYYHDELDKALHNFNLKAIFVYPRDRLDADMKTFGKLLFTISMIMSSLITKSTAEAEKMRDSLGLNDLNGEDNALDMNMMRDEDSLKMFKIRVEDLVDSFTEFGLL